MNITMMSIDDGAEDDEDWDGEDNELSSCQVEHQSKAIMT